MFFLLNLLVDGVFLVFCYCRDRFRENNPVPDFFGWPVPGFGTASGGGQSVQRVTETSPPPRSAVISSRDSSTWPRGVYAQELEP